MRRPGFRVAVQGIREALRYQADLQLFAAAAAAASAMGKLLVGDDGATAPVEQIRSSKDQLAALVALLRLSHLRQRFALDAAEPPQPPKVPPNVKRLIEELTEWAESRIHPNVTIGEARRIIDEWNARDAEREAKGDMVPRKRRFR
jgi:hypothetical protein